MSFLVALVTLICILPLFLFVKYRAKQITKNFVPMSQSEKYEILSRYMPAPVNKTKGYEEFDMDQEIEDYLEENAVNVVMEGNSIYWVQDNVFYTANVIGDEVDQESIHPIDTESMSKSELEKMLIILDTLKE